MALWIGCEFPFRQFKDYMALVQKPKFRLYLLKNSYTVVLYDHFPVYGIPSDC